MGKLRLKFHCHHIWSLLKGKMIPGCLLQAKVTLIHHIKLKYNTFPVCKHKPFVLDHFFMEIYVKQYTNYTSLLPQWRSLMFRPCSLHNTLKKHTSHSQLSLLFSTDVNHVWLQENNGSTTMLPMVLPAVRRILKAVGCQARSPTRLLCPSRVTVASVIGLVSPPSGICHTFNIKQTYICVSYNFYSFPDILLTLLLSEPSFPSPSPS